MTSPPPVIWKMCSASATTMVASSLRRYLSLRNALASSTAARVSCPGCSSSFISRRSNSVNASAVAPAKPPITPACNLRTFLTFGFTTCDPSVTCPSAMSTTSPSLRTHRTVVARADELVNVRAEGAPPGRAATEAAASCFATRRSMLGTRASCCVDRDEVVVQFGDVSGRSRDVSKQMNRRAPHRVENPFVTTIAPRDTPFRRLLVRPSLI